MVLQCGYGEAVEFWKNGEEAMENGECGMKNSMGTWTCVMTSTCMVKRAGQSGGNGCGFE